jgi:hypothetical protein
MEMGVEEFEGLGKSGLEMEMKEMCWGRGEERRMAFTRESQRDQSVCEGVGAVR